MRNGQRRVSAIADAKASAYLDGRVASLWCFTAFDHDGFDLARPAAPECRGGVVFRRFEACHALLEGRKLDDDETVKLVRPFHDLEAAAARQHLAAELGDDPRHQIGIFLVFDRIGDVRTCDTIGWHAGFLFYDLALRFIILFEPLAMGSRGMAAIARPPIEPAVCVLFATHNSV